MTQFWLSIVKLALNLPGSSLNQARGFVLIRCLNPGPSICSNHKSVWGPPVMCQLPALESDQGMMGVTRDPAQDEDTVVTACLSGEAGREYSISSQG